MVSTFAPSFGLGDWAFSFKALALCFWVVVEDSSLITLLLFQNVGFFQHSLCIKSEQILLISLLAAEMFNTILADIHHIHIFGQSQSLYSHLLLLPSDQ
jgi:hypothetical protein